MSITTKGRYLLVLLMLAYVPSDALSQPQQPNIVIIFADDLGYGDLGSYGHPTMRTPNLDRMGEQGMRFTQFYVAASICTPSRAALLTGRLPIRSGMSGTETSGNVLYPRSRGGVPASEITIAEALQAAGYQTGIIGKWHLGHLPKYLPLNNGFDYWFGIPYSNDMVPPRYEKAPPLPLYENDKVIESGPDQAELTKRYTDKAIDFITENRDRSFFLYYASHWPHTPLHASENFRGKSKRGLYGDVVAELDWSVGRVLETLQRLDLDENTLVFFTSDNGPWLKREEDGGSPGILFEGKGSTYEGGFRVPAIAWWPGMIEPDQTSTAIVTAMDLFPTLSRLGGATVSSDVKLDGTDIFPILSGEKDRVNDVVFYYFRDTIRAVRKGQWKAHFITKPSYTRVEPKVHDPPLLYNVERDPSEKYEVGDEHPDVIAEISRIKKEHDAGVVPVTSQLDKGY